MVFIPFKDQIIGLFPLTCEKDLSVQTIHNSHPLEQRNLMVVGKVAL